ncbi:MAG: hypothetical protein FH749_12105 [Firmicutes bacterium]|nr:hypothetical protein [Bacillota bacterium]
MKMRDAKKYGLSDFQWASVLICTILGAGITTLPRTIAETAGRDGWISILIAGAATWAMAAFVWLLCRKFPTKTLPEFSVLILGRPLGALVSVMYAIYAIGISGVALRIFTELATTWTLIWTPQPVFLLANLVPVVYISRMGAVTLGRLMELVVYMTGTVIFVYLVPLAEFDILNLRPVGAEGLPAILSAIPDASFAFLGFEVLLVFFPFIINRDRVLRITLLALTVITVLYAGNVFLTFGVLGVEHTLLQTWPLMNYLRVGTLPFIQRVDNLVLFIWTAQVIGLVAIQYYAGTFTLATLTRHHYHDIWALVAWPVVYAVAIIPERLSEVFELGDQIGRWGLFGILGLTGLLLLVAKIRGLDESKEEKID